MGGNVKDKFNYFLRNNWVTEQARELSQQTNIASLTGGTGASTLTSASIAVTSVSRVIMYSEDGTAYRLVVNNDASLSAIAV